MSMHPDLPDTLVHFTGRPRGQRDVPPDFARGTAEERMVSILHSGVLRGAPDFWATAPVVCFSEVTETARRVMLRDGVGGRGPYEPWGVVLDRAQLISAGARPVLYLSKEEMDQTRTLPTRLRNRRVRYDPGFSDWLHEREWRLCFEPEQTPELAITPQLVVGVIVGRQGWMPAPRQMGVADAALEAKALLQTARAQIEELKAAAVDLPGSVQRLSVSGGTSRTKFAGAADRLARWYWDGEDLVPDGVFDIWEQQMRGLPYDGMGSGIEVSLKVDFTPGGGGR
ncbi:hypothetical protein [Streptomyces sp. C3-3]|uniref:hypothetical protein n=1 Tax=Streptomyces sp. C3-3 TaxID=2824901 RepID=UPI001B39551C|nr:hypothetical protein [Streptomyces sp. C3-3]MBQ1116995.1 hypothetical protein [Streptomyces sp. C3-3]